MKYTTITLFAILFATTQLQAQIKFGGNVNYYQPLGIQKSSAAPFLFLKNATSAGLEMSFAPIQNSTFRIKFSSEFIMGSNDETQIASYAKENDIDYSSFQFSNPRPFGTNLILSPQFMLFPKSQSKKLPLMWLDLKVGAMFSNQQSLQFFYNGQSNPSKEIKTNAVSFVYNPTFVINVVKTKKLFLNLRAGYSNYGGFSFGISIADKDCRNAPCFRCCGAGCNGSCYTESDNLLNN